MQMQVGRVEDIGKVDGVFWMSFHDFFMNFATLSLCRFFDNDWTEVSFESEWSRVLGSAGGCANNDTVS